MMGIAKAFSGIGEGIAKAWKGSSKTTKTAAKVAAGSVAAGGVIYMGGSAAGAGMANLTSGLEEAGTNIRDTVNNAGGQIAGSTVFLLLIVVAIIGIVALGKKVLK